MKITLGSEVKDTITGFTGIAVARDEWINGCVRYGIQPPMTKDDKEIPIVCWIDEKQIKVIKDATLKPKRVSGGPQQDPQTRRGAK